MFKLIEYHTIDPATKGIGVAGMHTDSTLRMATFGIPLVDDPDTWIAANAATITAAFDSARMLDIPDTVRSLIESSRDAEANEIISSLGDIADIHETRHARRIQKAFARVVISEINILRELGDLSERTIEQLVTAMKNELEGMA